MQSSKIGKLAFSVSKIYVSTYSSGWNGFENWGIPKEQADFSFTRDAAGNRKFELYAGSQLIFRASHKPVGPSFPLTSKIIPLTRLVQRLRDQLLQTELGLSGTAQWTSLKEIAVHSSFFPPVDRLTPLTTLSIQNFRMVFSVPMPLP